MGESGIGVGGRGPRCGAAAPRPAALLAAALAVALASAALVPAAAAQQGGVVINEIDTNPPGPDTGPIPIEWVELYNPTGADVDVGGWQIASTTIQRITLTMPEGTVIEAGSFAVFFHERRWFNDAVEVVQLRNASGGVVDQTPRMSDLAGGRDSWSRVADGLDTDADSDWRFGPASAGTSNANAPGAGAGGEGPGGGEARAPVAVGTDRASYELGQYAVISGNVSAPPTAFGSTTVEVEVSGPGGYEREFTLHPDVDLRFEARLGLIGVLGASEGRYEVSAAYGGSSAAASFDVGPRAAASQGGPGSAPSLEFRPDRGRYEPGDTVRVEGTAGRTIPLEGLSLVVLDPRSEPSHSITLYPDAAGRFAGKLFMNPVSPVLGTYTAIARYAGAEASFTFELGEGGGTARKLTVRTDRDGYAPGDTVVITGRLAGVWTYALDLEVRQIRAHGPDGSRAAGVTLSKDVGTIRLAGDGTFRHEFELPTGEARHGEYRVRVEKNVGSAEALFTVGPPPEAAAGGPAPVPEGGQPGLGGARQPITVGTDSGVYEPGAPIVISGKVSVGPQSPPHARSVEITVARSGGDQIASRGEDGSVRYVLTAVPDGAGNFEASDKLHASLYPVGSYTVSASHANGRATARTTFDIVDPLNIPEGIRLAPSGDVFAPGETVEVAGSVARLAQGSGVDIVLNKPGGDTDKFGALTDNSRFSWSWRIPVAEGPESPVYGVYHAVFSAGPTSRTVFFKVSPDPSSDALEIPPLTIYLGRETYAAGEELEVSGAAHKRHYGSEGLVVQERAKVAVRQAYPPYAHIYESSLYLDAGGRFDARFDLPIGIFKEGRYRVTASYAGDRTEAFFSVDNEYVRTAGRDGAAPRAMSVSTDRQSYLPGQAVKITGSFNQLVRADGVDVTVAREEQTRITCGAFVCGEPGETVRVLPTATGTFSHSHRLGGTAEAWGSYVVTADTDFGRATAAFTVAGEPPGAAPAAGGNGTAAPAAGGNGTAAPAAGGNGTAAPAAGGNGTAAPAAGGNGTAAPAAGGNGTAAPAPAAARHTEKVNRITNDTIRVATGQSVVDGATLHPRVFQGSMFTAARGHEPSVNIMLVSSGGTCVIGPAAGGSDGPCLVSNSTRAHGSIYRVVQIDGEDYKVLYSGTDARLERFAVVPADRAGTIHVPEWTATILKDGQQQSMFYYKITRVPGAG